MPLCTERYSAQYTFPSFLQFESNDSDNTAVVDVTCVPICRIFGAAGLRLGADVGIEVGCEVG